MKSKC